MTIIIKKKEHRERERGAWWRCANFEMFTSKSLCHMKGVDITATVYPSLQTLNRLV